MTSTILKLRIKYVLRCITRKLTARSPLPYHLWIGEESIRRFGETNPRILARHQFMMTYHLELEANPAKRRKLRSVMET